MPSFLRLVIPRSSSATSMLALLSFSPWLFRLSPLVALSLSQEEGVCRSKLDIVSAFTDHVLKGFGLHTVSHLSMSFAD